MNKKVSVIGDGGWGTTLAIMLANKKLDVVLWGAFEDYSSQISKTRENVRFLPGVVIPSEVRITSNIEDALQDSGMIILAVPSQFIRSVLEKIKGHDLKNKIVVSVIKGIENNTLMRVSEIVEDVLGGLDFAVLSGPCIAYEVSRQLPTAVVTASRDESVANTVQEIFMSSRFRVYTSSDVAGVELGGALKNIIAIAAGIVDGLGYGNNTKAGLLTRGLVEITRLGVAMGAKPETFYGLSGMGDLITTCTSSHGRNRFVGDEIAKGKMIKDILHMPQVAEGVATALSVKKLAEKYKIEMPISEEIYSIIYENRNPQVAIMDLMCREKKEEGLF